MNRLFLVLWLGGCGGAGVAPDAGSPMTTADAGSVSDAGSSPPDAGGPADAGGLADAGPGEPTLSSALLYREDFERLVDRSMLEGAYPIISERGAALSVEATATASRVLRVDYGADGGCQDAEVFLGKQLLGDSPQVIASWRFRVQSGFLWVQPQTHCGGAGTGSVELLLTRPQDLSGRVTLEVSAEPESPPLGAPAGVSWRVAIDDALATTTRRAVYAQQYRVTTHGPLALAQDQWHRVTLLLGRETRVGGGDGVVQVWVDGALVIDRTSAATGTAPIAGVRYPTTMRAGPSRAQSRWVDDVVVATP